MQQTTTLLFFFCCCLRVLSSESQQSSSKYLVGPDGNCHDSISTTPVVGPIGGQGILFAIQSHADDNDGVMITSLGFHIQRGNLLNNKIIEYEVYALSHEGFYADPNRDEQMSSLLADETSYDYRGKMDNWTLISQGTITSVLNLTASITSENGVDDFYQIPFDKFIETRLPRNGGVQSFYIATKTTSFIYLDPPMDKTLNDELTLSINSTTSNNNQGGTDNFYAPMILLGEGVTEYPMPTTIVMYLLKSFVGTIYFERECPSEAPSVSVSHVPSATPTVIASISPSSFATLTTAVPTMAPSIPPSSLPSLSPTECFEEITDGLLLSFSMDCIPGEDMPGESNAIRDTVLDFTTEAAEEDETLSDVNVKAAGVHCTDAANQLDFSMVISGKYHPPTRVGESASQPEKERAGASSSLQQVEATDITVETFDVPELEEGEAFPRITKTPTNKPTPLPGAVQQQDSNNTNEGNKDNILAILASIIGVFIVVLGGYLVFHKVQRRAARQRREQMARLDEEQMERECCAATEPGVVFERSY